MADRLPANIITPEILTPDSISADIMTTGALAVGAFSSGRVEEIGDADWFAVSLSAGTTYRIDVQGLQSGPFGDKFNPRLNGVYDSTGSFIDGTAREGGVTFSTDARGFFAPEADGVYYIAASSYNNVGDYRVRITDNWDDYSSDINTTGVLSRLDSYFVYDFAGNGIFDWAGDIDWFALDVTAGQEYTVFVNGQYNYDARMYADGFLNGVYDSAGTYIPQTRDADSGAARGDAKSSFVATTTGTYYVAAGLEDGSASGIGYDVVVVSDDYSQGPNNAGMLQLNAAKTGKFELSGDRDWFEITLQEGEEYNISMTGFGLFSMQIHSVRDANGMRFADVSAGQDFPYDSDIDVTFTAPSTGTYYVDVSGVRGYSGRNEYKVRVAQDDYADDITTEGRVTVGGTVKGNLQFRGDSDWIAVDLMAGSVYAIEMKGLSSVSGSLQNPYIYSLRDSAGNHIAGSSNDNAGPGFDALSYVTIEQTGTYYIDARTTGYQSGSGYTVAVSEVFDDFAATADTTGALSTMMPAMGMIENIRDKDWFATTLEAGAQYRINVASDAGDTGAPFFLGGVKTDAGADAGNLFVAGPDATGGREYYFTPDADGVAFVEVRGNPAEGQEGYTLSLTERVEIAGTDGNDFLTLGGMALRDVKAISGGNGTDMVSFDGATQGAVIDLAQDGVLLDGVALPLYSIENATGTSFADTFFGSDRAETFRGLGGNDLFYGSDGGRDIYAGGAGRDTVSYAGGREGVEASLLRERGGAGLAQDDLLRGIENLTGTAYDDLLTGDRGRNFLFGEGGDDIIMGNGGDDYILAGLGTDIIVFSYNRDEYTITQDGTATTVAQTGGNMLDGTDLIGNAEILRFADGDMML